YQKVSSDTIHLYHDYDPNSGDPDVHGDANGHRFHMAAVWNSATFAVTVVDGQIDGSDDPIFSELRFSVEPNFDYYDDFDLENPMVDVVEYPLQTIPNPDDIDNHDLYPEI